MKTRDMIKIVEIMVKSNTLAMNTGLIPYEDKNYTLYVSIEESEVKKT